MASGDPDNAAAEALRVAQEREAALREILDVISRSRDDDGPVFDTILENAARLCGADSAALMMTDEARTRNVRKRTYGAAQLAEVQGESRLLDSGHAHTEAVRTARVVHVKDMRKSPLYKGGDETWTFLVDEVGLRTVLAVPLMRGKEAIGAFVLHRLHEARAFSPEEIALVETFAAQGVIAIENVRQFRELQSRLEREKATRAVLEVISTSREDDQPVFDAILERAARLCNAPMARLHLVDADRTRHLMTAVWGEALIDLQAGHAWPLASDLPIPQAINEARVILIDDFAETQLYRDGDEVIRNLVEVEGLRSYAIVPLLKDGAAIGCITVSRREVAPFAPDDIALVETFAAQAVIAIENVRQFRELQRRLEREKATGEVLGVISRSRDDDLPVFDSILENAARLCDAALASLNILNEDGAGATLVAHWGESLTELGAGKTVWPMDSNLAPVLAIRENRVVYEADLKDTDLYRQGDEMRLISVDEEGIRTFLAAPLESGGRAIGCISLYRREVKPFTPDQITLIETFAAQAVIAIENVRQFRELQGANADLNSALDRQTATSEVLELINRAQDDPIQVLEKIAFTARDITHSERAGIWRLDGEDILIWAHTSSDPEMRAYFRENPVRLHDGSPPALAIVENRTRHFRDVRAEDELKGVAGHYGVARSRTLLTTPMTSPDGQPLGVIVLSRTEVAPFSDAEITLVETFADQAAIAIENARLLAELRTRLEREQATADVLNVISRSRDDDAPVFEAILDNACRLCEAPLAFLSLVDDDRDRFRVPAHRGAGDEMAAIWDEQALPLEGSGVVTARAITEKTVIHVEDLADDAAFDAPDEKRNELARLEGVRSYLVIPMFRGEEAIGTINLYRREVRPFTPDQIALVETFAAQAVIAIENVRQFRELQTRLEREKATGEVLSVISRSQGEDLPVFDTILENACRLCETPLATIVMGGPGDAAQTVVAERGADEATLREYTEHPPPMDPEASLAARAIVNGEVIHLDDMAASDAYRDGQRIVRYMVDEAGVRSVIFVPLISKQGPIGAIILFRREVRPFTAEHVSLISSFAAQAVIAIENVRQFRELQARLEREAATREILEVISRSRDDEQPVFEAILENASRLCKAPLAFLPMADEAGTHVAVPAFRGVRPEFAAALEEFNEPMEGSALVAVRAVAEAKVIRSDDLRDDPAFAATGRWRTELVDTEGARSVLVVPLMRGQGAIGAILLYRREVAPFSEDDVALVKTFAAQAVIAIENVRQFRELQNRLEREKATGEVLGVISRSRDDDLPVFDTILANAARLCDAPSARLMLADEARANFIISASWGDHLFEVEVGDTAPMDPGLPPARAILDGKVHHITDVRDDAGYAAGHTDVRRVVDDAGVRTLLIAPLITGDRAIGCIALSRLEVAPFAPDQIALVETFAAQAVIAIENVRQFRELQTRLEREAATREILGVISRSRDDETPVFDSILANAARLCDAETSALVLGRPDQNELRLAAYFTGDHVQTPEEAAAIERIRGAVMQMDPAQHVSAAAICSGETVHFEDLTQHPGYLAGEPSMKIMVEVQRERSILSVPLIDSQGPLGAINLHRKRVERFAEDDIALIESFAAQAVIAIDNVRQFKALEELNAELGDRVEEQVGEIERMGRLKRFLPAAVADAVVSSGSDKMLQSHRALLGILFCDIRGFTAFCERAEPEETIEVLQTYHEEMGRLIADSTASVDHRMGDGIMVLFNDPMPCDDPAGDAVRLALAMQNRMKDLCKQWKRLGHRLGFGVGVSLGYATVGMVGSEGRQEYTASGTAVNLASRLCDQAEDGEILLSPRAHIATEDDFDAEPFGEITLKGIQDPLEVFRVIAPKQS